MNLGMLVHRVRKAAGGFVSRLKRKDPGSVSEDLDAGDDGIADHLSGSPMEADSGSSRFPGFSPPPSPADRIRASASALADRVRDNPGVLLAATGSLAFLALVLLAFALIQRPPKPVTPSVVVSPKALEILRKIPVPRPDPLAEESALDRPRKDRYTEEEAARMWLDLGLIPTDALRERNRAELQTLLSAMEKR